MAGILIFCFKSAGELLLIGLPIVIALDCVVFYLPARVDFDEENIFIKKRSEPEVAVSLKNITQVKAIRWSIGFHTLCKITYEVNGKRARIYLYPRPFGTTLAEFINQLTNKNRAAEIKGF